MSFWSHSLFSKWAEDVERSETELPSPVQHAQKHRRLTLRRILSAGTSATVPPVTHDINTLHLENDDEKISVVSDSNDEVDVVVVDRDWSHTSQSQYDAESNGSTSLVSEDILQQRTKYSTEAVQGFWARVSIRHWWKTLWPSVQYFFNPKYPNPAVEAQYQRENWQHSKRLAVWASTFFIFNWIVGIIFIPTPLVLADRVYYYAVSPVVTIPLFVMCIYDFPRDRNTIYQVFLSMAVWSWSIYQVFFGYFCGFYGSELHLFTCGTKDFIATFYYTSALQTVALFGTHLNRLPALFGSLSFLAISSGMILPGRSSWTRYMLNFVVFEGFLLYMHYQRDIVARNLNETRIKLESQFQRTHRAQLNQRRAAESKHRLTSYVFHEVRVPLNTALLAVQNIAASKTVAKAVEVEFHALEGSLSMMSKVLNDVLDFNRLDNGRFESVSRPYMFHQVMRSMFMPLRLATDARNLQFVTELDPKIDDIARRAAYAAQGLSEEEIQRLMSQSPSDRDNCGLVLGDENRLMQIVFNLASNACKFTPSGGTLKITTKLILPTDPKTEMTTGKDSPSSRDEVETPPIKLAPPGEVVISEQMLSLDNLEKPNGTSRSVDELRFKDRIIVRIEVTDTGCGIKPKDMDQSKLFSAFNQTEQGRTQGITGTGLGLALVRLIVKLINGRLGVQSKVGEGSCFWVELPLVIGAKALALTTEHGIPACTPGGDLPVPIPASAYNSQCGLSMNPTTMDIADAIANRARQSSPLTIRSSSGLQGLVSHGSSFELSLSKFDPRSPVHKRLSDGSDDVSQPLTSTPETLENGQAVPLPLPPPLEKTEDSSDTIRSARPNFIHLPPKPSSISEIIHSSIPTSGSARSYPFEGGLEILVVDDDPMTRVLMKRLLERLGCVVTTAVNGDVALGLLLNATRTPASPSDMDGPILEQPVASSPTEYGSETQSRFAAVFLDNFMPILTGLETVRKLRELGRTDFIVGVTANALITDQNEYLEAGANHVLTKPVHERSLRSMLQVASERRRKALSTPKSTEEGVS